MRKEAAKIRKLLIVLLLLLIASACGSDSQPESSTEIPAPPVVILDTPDYQPGLPLIYDAVETDILSFNEYTVFLDFEPETRKIRGI